ncbi:YhgE/Pip domain-containing protein [Rhodococcus sp. NPDC058514]|uniref:YhgE/Pip domain-containing protein n=1 Tax=unclassified Rhodococcus (in: high G+C Gram-positive bacteria) TaxID=192944 RepID=UPI0036624B05
MVAAHASSRRGPWVIAAVAALLAAVVGVYFLVATEGASTRTVAIVNEDAGAVVDGKPMNAGEQVVAALQESSDFAWETVSADEGSADAYLASVTIPAGFSDAVNSLSTNAPRQAELAVHYNGDGSAADAETMAALMTTVSDQTGAQGIKDVLAGIASARAQLQQTLLPSQLLTAATNAADAQAQQLLGQADQVLPLLATANDGANQLVDVAGQVSAMVDGAAGPVTEVSGRLTELGVTLGDVTRSTEQLQGGLDAAAAALRAIGLQADTVRMLEQTRADLALVSGQLTSITGLLGTDAGPDTDLGGALRGGLGQLQDVSAQLTDAGNQLQAGIGPIAEQAPALLGTTKDQILTGVSQLKSVSTQLGEQLTKGVNTIPARNAAQQDRISSVLSAPVAVIQSGGTDAGSEVLTARNLAIVFAATTAALAAALVWTVRRRA